MRIYLLITTCIIFAINSFAQEGLNDKLITGKFVEENLVKSDTVNFLPLFFIDRKYYQISSISSEVKRNEFTIGKPITYPHLYFLSLKSENNIRPFRDGFYFLDTSTTSVKVYPNGSCSVINGNTYKEFIDKFQPFILRGSNSCKKKNFQNILFQNPEIFDQRLVEYISKNPNSYVGLWFLIFRYSEAGDRLKYRDAIKSFSAEMKKSELWQKFNGEIQNARLKQDGFFPELNLLNKELKEEPLKIPGSSNYVLIEYWFSACKPCIKKFPELKKLYNEFKDEGFSVIGISIDGQERISDWKKIINQMDLNWKQFLDKGGVQAKKDGIYQFPTAFLTNKKGEIINRDMTIEDLRKFLKDKLH